MKKTKIFAAAAALSISVSAQAIPVTFEFSGAVQQLSVGAEQWSGQRATGLFNFDTDNFTPLPNPGSQPATVWTDVLPANARPEPIQASLTIGSEVISMNSAVETYGGIHFVDVCRPVCGPFSLENWAISANTQSFALGSPTPAAGFTLSSLTFRSGTPFSVENPGSFDFFDATTATPESVLTLPLLWLVGTYNRSVFECRDVVNEDEDRCIPVSQISMNFNVDTVTRVATQSVPEPGTLALLGVGLLGAAFTRRRIGKA